MKYSFLVGLVMTAFCFCASAQGNSHSHGNDASVYHHDNRANMNAVVHQRTVTRTETQPNITYRHYNHGQEVSSVAHNTPRGRYHGRVVSSVARTNTYTSSSSHAAKVKYYRKRVKHHPGAHVKRYTTSTTVRQSY
jgi:hypothetical protein